MKSDRIKGLTVLDLMNNLDPALVSEAEVDARFLSPYMAETAAQKKERRAALRAERREQNPFLRFMSSGAGAVAVSLLVAFGLIVGIIIAINRTPADPLSPSGSANVGGRPEGSLVGTQASPGEGRIPVGTLDVNYTVAVDSWFYEVPPAVITLTATAKEPGVEIAAFQAVEIECLTEPGQESAFTYFWNDLATERAEPLGKDEYDRRSKTIYIDGVIPDGIYRIHHMEYDREEGTYVSGAFCNFAVGSAYAESELLAESGHAPGETVGSDGFVETSTTLTGDATYHIQSASIRRNRQGNIQLIITYKADKAGVTVWGPSTDFRIEKISGEENPEPLRFWITEEAIEYAAPTEEHDGHAVWTKLNPPTLENTEAMLPGVYRIYALSRQGEVMDAVDVYWDGEGETESEPPAAEPVRFTISVPDVVQYGTQALTVTYRALEAGKSFELGTIVLEGPEGNAESGSVRFVENELSYVILAASPDRVAEGTVTHEIENYQLMRDGTWRVLVMVDGEVMASAEFWLNTAVAG